MQTKRDNDFPTDPKEPREYAGCFHIRKAESRRGKSRMKENGMHPSADASSVLPSCQASEREIHVDLVLYWYHEFTRGVGRGCMRM